MNVKQLKELLELLPDHMPVVRTCMSDYDDVTPEQLTVRDVVSRNGQWMDYRASSWPKDDKPTLVQCLHFDGN